MLKYKERLIELKQDVRNKFNDLLEQKGTIDLAKAILISNDEDSSDSSYEKLVELDYESELPIIEMRNNMTGEVFDVYPISINKNGIVCVNVNEDDITNVMRFSDIASLEDQLNLLTEMDNHFC